MDFDGALARNDGDSFVSTCGLVTDVDALVANERGWGSLLGAFVTYESALVRHDGASLEHVRASVSSV